jgi:hypothetical protein
MALQYDAPQESPNSWLLTIHRLATYAQIPDTDVDD